MLVPRRVRTWITWRAIVAARRVLVRCPCAHRRVSQFSAGEEKKRKRKEEEDLRAAHRLQWVMPSGA